MSEIPANLARIISGHRPDLPPERVRKYQIRAREQYGWDGKILEHADPLECMHRGEEIRQVPCELCPGTGDQIMRPVFSCDIHGECMRRNVGAEGLKVCRKCPDRNLTSELPEIHTRNVIFHVWPLKRNDHWKWNCDQLKKRESLFNGFKVCGIVTSHDSCDPREVMDYLGPDWQYIIRPNNRKLREVMTLRPMLGMVESVDSHTATLVCQAKGVTKHFNEGSTIQHWVQALWELNCDYWEKIGSLLRQFPIVGSFKKLNVFGKHRWHYSGSFYWLRNDHLFNRMYEIENVWWGYESFPGNNYSRAEGGVLFKEGGSEINLYNMQVWMKLSQELKKWKAENE